MRIISGKLKGRRFYPKNNFPTRPTTDFAKEGLFNIIGHHFDFEDVRFLDLFCGSGNISYEFASRGCTDITSIDKFPGCVKFVKETATAWGIQGMNVLRMDVVKFITSCSDKFDIIFAGPPYAWELIDDMPEMIWENELLEEGGWFILEHSPAHNFENDLRFSFSRNYGKTIFSIFEKT